MTKELEIFKKRILYRASYRGTKEMDILLSSFVKKYINKFDKEQLNQLEIFLMFEDEIIKNYYNFDIIENDIDKNYKFKIFKKFKI